MLKKVFQRKFNFKILQKLDNVSLICPEEIEVFLKVITELFNFLFMEVISSWINEFFPVQTWEKVKIQNRAYITMIEKSLFQSHRHA